MDVMKAGGQGNYSIRNEKMNQPQDNAEKVKKNLPPDAEKTLKDNAVTYEKESVSVKKYNYEKPKPDPKLIQQLKAEADQRYQGLKQMVRDMLKKQGLTFQDVMDGKPIFVDEETRAAAQKSIEPGGEFSVDAVAGRIVDFAKAISGGDPSKIKELRGAIEKGFADAKKAFGGSLPEISQKTHDEVMKRLDAWEKGDEENK